MTLEARVVINLVSTHIYVYAVLSTCISALVSRYVLVLSTDLMVHVSLYAIMCAWMYEFNLLQILFVLFGCIGGYVSASVYKSESIL